LIQAEDRKRRTLYNAPLSFCLTLQEQQGWGCGTLRCMNKPVIAAKKAFVADLAAGSYWWCACGQSKKQPYCDGSHQGTGFMPLEFTIDVPKSVKLCLCKYTAAAPYCDGAHKKL